MATAFYQLKNWSSTTLASDCDGVTGTIEVTSGLALPPAPFVAVIWNANLYATPELDAGAEVVICTVKATNTMTVTRAQEGTTGHSHSTGDTVAVRLTAGVLAQIQAAVNTLEGSPTLTGLAVGVLTVNGNATLGLTNTNTITNVGRLVVRTVGSDPLTGTSGRPAGSTGEVVFYNGSWYGCSDEATPTWKKLDN